MVFPNNHPNPALRGQAKGLEINLKERGLWPGNGRRTDGFRFLQCPANRDKCNQDDPEIRGQCCAGTLMGCTTRFSRTERSFERGA
jgi:hypothetical protein